MSFSECKLGEAIVAESPGGKRFIFLFLLYIVCLFNVCLPHYTENSVMVQNMSLMLTLYPQDLAEWLTFTTLSKYL